MLQILFYLVFQTFAYADAPLIVGGTTMASGDAVTRSTVSIAGQFYRTNFICSGTIIADDLVITAAHCLGPYQNASLTVFFGTDMKGTNIAVADRAALIPAIPPDSQVHDWDDLAMLRLASKIPAGYAPATLLTDASLLQNGTGILLAGFGIAVPTESNNMEKDGAGVLRAVNQTILQIPYGEREILINSANGKAACYGDSGGPAYLQLNGTLYLFGVTSRLTDDDLITPPGMHEKYSCSKDMVYSNLLMHKDWLDQTMQKLHQTP